jgi:hypothetical protein
MASKFMMIKIMIIVHTYITKFQLDITRVNIMTLHPYFVDHSFTCSVMFIFYYYALNF